MPSAAEQLDWWCNFQVWIQVVCWQEMKVKLVNTNSVLGECFCQNNTTITITKQRMTPSFKTRFSRSARVFQMPNGSFQIEACHLKCRSGGCLERLFSIWVGVSSVVTQVTDLQSPWQLSNSHLLMRTGKKLLKWLCVNSKLSDLPN